jgi:DNA-binding transcriptional ArsR family regulator
MNTPRLTTGPAGVAIDDSQAYELFFSLAALAAPAAFPRWRAWAEGAVGEYAEAERVRLRRWFGGAWTLGLACTSLVPLLPAPADAATLLRTLADLPLGDFVRICVTAGYTDPTAPLDANTLLALRHDARGAVAFVERYLQLSGRARGQVLRVLADPEGARADLLALLRRQAEAPAFQIALVETAGERERATKALQRLAAGPAEALPAWLAGPTALGGYTPVVLAASAFLDARSARYYQEVARSLLDDRSYEPLIIVAGTRLATGEAPYARAPKAPKTFLLGETEGGDPWQRAASVFALLADPSRLRLVRLLAERSHYGQELAAALGMSGATVSHHVDQLFKLGVVRVERHAHRTYYVLRAGVLGGLLRDATATVTGALTRSENL